MKMKSMRWLLVVLLAWSLAPGVPAGEDSPESALAVAKKLVEAFNRHDPDAMAALVTEDFELFYIDDKGAAGLATRGPEQLAEEMKRYFAAHPEVRSEIADAVDGPVFVSFREQIVGGRRGGVHRARDQPLRVSGISGDSGSASSSGTSIYVR